MIPEVLVSSRRVYLRVRRKQKGGLAVREAAERGEFRTVTEGGLKLLVNFYGLPRHRPVPRPSAHARGDRRAREVQAVRTSFAYTCTASVFSGKRRRRRDHEHRLVAHYLDWARRNFELNGFRDSSRHRLPQEDVRMARGADARVYHDLVFLDPPTLSRSKRMDGEPRAGDVTSSSSGRRCGLAPGRSAGLPDELRKFRVGCTRARGARCEGDVTAATIPARLRARPEDPPAVLARFACVPAAAGVAARGR
jgi:23S rRNA (guanine2445-N2)-methyltransferase / 23S rRNA (guanine2069-N7)-methyltransferase